MLSLYIRAAPPNACRNIHVRQRGSRNITLSWTKPTSTGRNDFYYLIDVSDGDTLSRYSFEDRRDRVEEVVGGLRPDTEYTFTVTVHNGVSEQDLRNENLRQCELTMTTEEASKLHKHICACRLVCYQKGEVCYQKFL